MTYKRFIFAFEKLVNSKDNKNELWTKIAQLTEKDNYMLAKLQEQLFEQCFPLEFSATKFYLEDKNHFADLFYGDLISKILNVAIDLKVGRGNCAGAINNSSLNVFTGWYLTFNKYGTKMYFLEADYLRRKRALGQLTNSNILDAYGELDYKDLVDNKHAFYYSKN